MFETPEQLTMSDRAGLSLKNIAEGTRSEAVVETAEARAARVVEKQTQRRIFKIIVIGDSNVGKTCLTYRFCIGKFPDKTEATIGVDFREKLVQIDSEYLKVNYSFLSHEHASCESSA